MRYIVDDEITFEDLELAKKYYYDDEQIDDYFIEKNNEIKNATSLEEVVKAVNALADDYYIGRILVIKDTETRKYYRY